MQGLASKSFYKKTNIKLSAKWPLLFDLIENKYFIYLDYFFVEKTFPEADEDEALFLAFLMASSRMGHISVLVRDSEFLPVVEDKTLEEKMRRGSAKILSKIDRISIAHFQGHFYLKKNAFFEMRAAKHLERLLSSIPKPCIKPKIVSSSLTKEQAQALQYAFDSPLSLITGGPGTGKTFTAKEIVSAFLQDAACRVVVCAPTGKAASHLSSLFSEQELKQLRTGTLHSVLRIRSFEDLMQERGYLDADLVIIDEASMIDAALFSFLLSSIQEGTRLILMGDKNQLPPIENGSFFSDLVSLQTRIPCTTLSQVLRSDLPKILLLAQAIHDQKVENFFHHLEKYPEIWIDLGLRHQKIASAHEKIWNFIKEEFPTPQAEMPSVEFWLKKLHSFRLLSALKKGYFGSDLLNEWIEKKMLGNAHENDYWLIPIMIIQSDEEMDLYNGQMGILVRQVGQKAHDYALFSSGHSCRRFSLHELPSFEYAYCLSVHKSQGSEYENVVLLLPEGSEVFSKELLYTALTRAKRNIYIDGKKEVIEAILNKKSQRNSALSLRLIEGK